MTTSFGFYLDAGKTLPLTTAAVFSMNVDGSTGPVDTILFFGSTVTGRLARAASNPGVDMLTVSIEDANPGGGQPSTAVKLALDAAGLATATAGAPLNLGITERLSSASGFPIHVRYTDQTGVVGNYADLALKTCDLFETAV
ncbi:MAG: hypothetical protein Q8O33_04440 [Pseudomonadota bacterium]|nr:hypothetical protein [Pseudomonadota bacterium]